MKVFEAQSDADIFTFDFFPDWGFSPRAGDRRGNRLQVGDLQQGFVINVCGEDEEQKGQKDEATVESNDP